MKDFDFDFADIVMNAKDIVIITKSSPLDEPGPEIVYVNKAFTELTGYAEDEVIGKSPRILQRPHSRDEPVNAKIRDALENQSSVRETIKNYSKEGREYWLEMNIFPLKNKAGEIAYFAAVERDVTERKIIEEQLEILARRDPLTNLLNRRALEERLINEHSRYLRTGDSYALLMFDVDRFKSINDTYGHSVGDEVLVEISNICQDILREHDTVSRLGGDEFCIVLPCTELAIAANVAKKIQQSVLAIRIASLNEPVSISIGVAQVEESDESYVNVMKRSDDCLYVVKKTGRGDVYSGKDR